jgi:hypothetical protein
LTTEIAASLSALTTRNEGCLYHCIFNKVVNGYCEVPEEDTGITITTPNISCYLVLGEW